MSANRQALTIDGTPGEGSCECARQKLHVRPVVAQYQIPAAVVSRIRSEDNEAVLIGKRKRVGHTSPGSAGAVKHDYERKGRAGRVSTWNIQDAVTVVLEADRVLARREVVGARRSRRCGGGKRCQSSQKAPSVVRHDRTNVITDLSSAADL